jgi:hypothetical protein
VVQHLHGWSGQLTKAQKPARTATLSTPITAFHAPLGLGGEMAISPDELWMLCERIDRVGSELMLIENFR